jgi:hypothetical protein
MILQIFIVAAFLLVAIGLVGPILNWEYNDILKHPEKYKDLEPPSMWP